MRDTETTINKALGQRIGKLRAVNDETQQELSDAIGVSREIIAHWENGDRQIKADAIYKLAKHFNVTADYLLGISKNSSINEDEQIAAQTTGLSTETIKVLHHLNRKQLEGIEEYVSFLLYISKSENMA